MRTLFGSRPAQGSKILDYNWIASAAFARYMTAVRAPQDEIERFAFCDFRHKALTVRAIRCPPLMDCHCFYN